MAQNHEDSLIEEILADARKKAERTVRRAAREAKQEIERAQKEAEKAASDAIDVARDKAGKEKNTVLATIEVEAARLRLDLEETVITEAFEAARKRLLDKRSYDYQAALSRLAVLAAQAIGGGRFRLAMSADDREAIDIEALRRRLTGQLGRDIELIPADEPARISGGLILHSDDGTKLVDNSFESRLARMHDDLRRQVAEILLEREVDS